jgi:hypothetical protein
VLYVLICLLIILYINCEMNKNKQKEQNYVTNKYKNGNGPEFTTHLWD